MKGFDTTAALHINVVIDWFEELTHLVPTED